MQLVSPGEFAPAYRHTQTALPFVREGKGAIMSVNAERTPMRVGDVISTLPTVWHDHGNSGDGPVFWLDGLDIPVVQFLDASFAEGLGQDQQPISRPDGGSDAR